MGTPNLGCSQPVGHGGQAALPQWGSSSSEWEWEPGAKRTQSWAATQGGLAIRAGPFHHHPLPCLAFVTHTGSPAPCRALLPEPPMTQPRLQARLSQTQTAWKGFPCLPPPPAGFLHSLTANHKGSCPKPQRESPSLKPWQERRWGRRGGSPGSWVLEHTTFTHWKPLLFSYYTIKTQRGKSL